MDRQESTEAELAVTVVNGVVGGESLPGSAPRGSNGHLNTKSRVSTMLETLKTSVAWKRKQIPSFVQGVVPSCNNCNVDISKANNNWPPTSFGIDSELSERTIMHRTRDAPYYNTEHASSPDDSLWREEDTLTQPPELKTVLTPAIDSPHGAGAIWTQGGDITIRVGAHLQIVKEISSALLDKDSDAEMSPLSALAASYELASSSNINKAASVTSTSSSVFLKAMSSSDFDLAHEEVFGVLPPVTPREFKPI